MTPTCVLCRQEVDPRWLSVERFDENDYVHTRCLKALSRDAPAPRPYQPDPSYPWNALTVRQAVAYRALLDEEMTPRDVGALWHAHEQRHDAKKPCDGCLRAGRNLIAELDRLALVAGGQRFGSVRGIDVGAAAEQRASRRADGGSLSERRAH